MKKSILIAVIFLLLAAIIGGVVLWQQISKDPAVVGELFLQQIVEQNFAELDIYFNSEPHPTSLELGQAFYQFGQAFGLVDISLEELSLLVKDNKLADFNFTLNYTSNFFEPVQMEANLRLTRDNILGDWEVQWEDNLPLADYGISADYARVRQEPKRGRILDSKGLILAGEGSLVSVGVQPDRITDPDLLLETLEAELGLQPDYVRRQYEAPGVQGHWFVPLVSLTEIEYNRVEALLRPIPGIFFRRVDARAYPQGIDMSHLTGYLGEVTATMLEVYPEREYLSGEIVGRAGLEQSQDDRLRGRPGYRFYIEKDDFRELFTEKATLDGEDVVITIDTQMQSLAYEVLGDRVGALVVLDAETGAILTLASAPSYDANEFVGGISQSRWSELSSDLQLPMFNRAVQGLYPPGSVFKVITVSAALDQGLYDAGSIFIDTGELGVQGNIVRNYQRQVFGEHILHQAIVESINTTVARVGLELGAENLKKYFKSYGLDQSYYLGLPMVSGQIGSPERSLVALAWSAIGQDQVLLTPLHMAQIFAIFANRGYLPPIHLLRNEEQLEGNLVLKSETVTQMNSMLQDVVLQGTGISLRNSALNVYGKTGTAEMVGGQMHAWFAGHTELASGQKLAFSILVEEGGVGGQAAAPLIAEYLNRLVQ